MLIEGDYNFVKLLVFVFLCFNKNKPLELLPSFLAFVFVSCWRVRYLWLIALRMVGLITCSALSIIKIRELLSNRHMN